jgi:hypothetical protein
MESPVSLPQLPDRFEVPQQLSDRLSCDAKRSELVFREVMSKSIFDKVRKVSADFAYQRSVEQLIREATAPEAAGKPVAKVGILLAASASALVIALSIALAMLLLRERRQLIR